MILRLSTFQPFERLEVGRGLPGAAGRAAKYGRPALGEGAEIVDGVPVVAVPLIVGARVVGALECAGGEPRELSAEVLTSLETLATHAAAAIEASRLHQDAEAMSVTDALTGLANRRQLDRDLPTEVDRADLGHAAGEQGVADRSGEHDGNEDRVLRWFEGVLHLLLV